MKYQLGMQQVNRDHRIKWRLRALWSTIGLILLAAVPLCAQEKKDPGTTGNGDSIGFIASKNPDPKAVGLPVYPGARPHQDQSDDTPKFQLGLWGGTKGFNLVVLKLESNDSPDKITRFYRKALGKYGKVLTCIGSAEISDAQENADSAGELNCQDDHPDRGETVLKAGTKEQLHLFSMKPEGGVSVFQLVYVQVPPPDDKK
jgi:hypothetical protein